MGLRELLLETGVLKEEEGAMGLNHSISPNLVHTDALKKAYIKGSFLDQAVYQIQRKPIIWSLL